MTIGISVIVYFFVPAEPATAWFLTPEQRGVLAVEQLLNIQELADL